jgi:hypothetical protein
VAADQILPQFNFCFAEPDEPAHVFFSARNQLRKRAFSISFFAETALAKAPARTFMFVESGEEALGEIANAIATKLGLGAAQSWSADEAIAAWGRNMAVFSLGSNSRVRGKAAAALGWSPVHRSITRWIVEELT